MNFLKKILLLLLLQHCGSQPRQHCYPETKCHRTPDTQCVPVQKEKCEKVPVETTEFVEEKQCLPFQLDLAQLSNAQGDPCAGYHVPQQVRIQLQPTFWVKQIPFFLFTAPTFAELCWPS